MSTVPEDPVQTRIAQLEAIAARRNELLGEMYQLMRQRNGIGSIIDELDSEGEELQSFLDNFDLQKMGERGFIENHVEKLLKSLSTSLLPALDTGEHDLDWSAGNDAQKEERAPHASSNDHGDQEEDIEEDQDELDLIGGTNSAASEAVEFQSRNPDAPGVTTTEPDMVVAGEMKEEGRKVLDDNEAMNVEIVPSSTNPTGQFSASTTKAGMTNYSLAEQLPPTHTNDIVQQPPDTETHSTSASNAGLLPAPGETPGQRDSQVEGSSQRPNRPDRVTHKATPADTGISPSLLIAQKSPITIPAPIESSLSTDQYNVAVAPLPDKPPPLDLQSQHINKVDYTLPSLNILPPEFSRKKTSKRKKDRSDKKGGDDLPMGLNRWAATLGANPVYSRLKRSTKCLSTREWSIAIAELRLVRTVDRIEKLKHEGRWGFRQTKKQRGVGGLLKTHWDYLLDEMKWMRTDFREERKWKLALAYNLSTSVLEWHALHTWEERVAHGVCVKWKPVQEEELGDDEIEVEGGDDNVVAGVADEPELGRHASLIAVDYTSDDDDMDAEEVDSKDVEDPLEPTTEIQGVLEGIMENKALEDERAVTGEDRSGLVEPKKEDIDDAAAFRGIGGADSILSNAGKETQPEIELMALKPTSKDPILGSKSSSHSLNGDADEGKSNNMKAKINAYAPMRGKIVYGPSDKLFINSEDLDFFATSENPEKSEQSLLHALGLSTLFPELQPFGMLDVAPAVTVEPTKKKSSRSADKDDPNKRVEETNYTKVMHSSKFMTLRPTLLGPLQPSKRWKDGKWLPMEEYAIPAELDSPNRITEESLCELFDFKVKAPGKGDGLQARDARQPRNDQYWSANDDLLLKSLVDRYPGNWNLIAECFNGARLTTPSDRRTPPDCQDRWRAKWGTDLQAKSFLAQDNITQGDEQATQASGANADSSQSGNDTRSTVGTSVSATSLGTSSMTTRGVKRLASASISSQQAPSIGGAGSEPKKRRRHFLIQETIRRASKKRQENAQKMLANQRKQPGIMHDTHVQLQKLAKVTPAELSRQKAEREAAQLAEIQKARARQEELNGKNIPRLAGIPVPPQAAAALQAAQQQQQAQGQGQGQGQPGQPQAPHPPLTPQQLQHQLLLQAQATQAQAQAQANQSNSRPGPTAPVATARQGNVNIARISTPNAASGIAASRLTPQQLLQLQQQPRSLSQQMASGVVINGSGAPATGANGNVINRDPTASPSLGVGNSPSPANVPQTGMTQAQAVAAASRNAAGSHYFPATGYSAEQINGLRMMMLHQQQIHQQQQQQQQNQGS